MKNIAEFVIANIKSDPNESSLGAFYALNGNTVKQQKGPSGYEKYCLIEENNITVPHADLFSYNSLKNIVLTGITEQYTIPIYDNNFEDSVKEYFLKNGSNNEIQYLFWDNGQKDSSIEYKVMIPGLLYTSNGTILGYLHSYTADESGNVILELPYPDYSGISIDYSSKEQIDNTIKIKGITSKTEITITDGTNSVSFNLYPHNSSSGSQVYKIKNVNEFAKYILAAQLTDGKITSIIDMLTAIELRSFYVYNYHTGQEEFKSEYLPKYFLSLRLYASSETAKNMTPTIYKTPAAIVPTGNNDECVFMRDVTSISANIITGFWKEE